MGGHARCPEELIIAEGQDDLGPPSPCCGVSRAGTAVMDGEAHPRKEPLVRDVAGNEEVLRQH